MDHLKQTINEMSNKASKHVDDIKRSEFIYFNENECLHREIERFLSGLVKGLEDKSTKGIYFPKPNEHVIFNNIDWVIFGHRISFSTLEHRTEVCELTDHISRNINVFYQFLKHIFKDTCFKVNMREFGGSRVSLEIYVE